MSTVSLELFKMHVRADDFAGDDALLEHYLDASEEWVVNATARTLDDLLELGGGKLPPSIVQAVMMLGGHLYNQRESVSAVQMQEVPYSVQALVKPYRRFGSDAGRTDEE